MEEINKGREEVLVYLGIIVINIILNRLIGLSMLMRMMNKKKVVKVFKIGIRINSKISMEVEDKAKVPVKVMKMMKKMMVISIRVMLMILKRN